MTRLPKKPASPRTRTLDRAIPGGTLARHTANLGKVFVKLIDVRKRTQGQFELMDRVRKTVLPKFAAENLRTSVSQVEAISGGGHSNKEIAFYVSGPDIRKLSESSRRLTTALGRVPGVVDVDTTLVLGKPELAVDLDRKKAAELGVQVADVADTLRVMVGGRKISTYTENGESSRRTPSCRSTT